MLPNLQREKGTQEIAEPPEECENPAENYPQFVSDPKSVFYITMSVSIGFSVKELSKWFRCV